MINDLKYNNFNMCEDPWVISLKTSLHNELEPLDKIQINDLKKEDYLLDELNIVQEIED